MQLQDFKKSITQLSWDEQVSLHRAVRVSRTEKKESTNKARAKRTKVVGKAKREISQDVNKIKELLRLLGEEV